MKARKLPSGNWFARAYSHEENGKKIYESFTAPTQAEAEYLANKFKFDRKKAVKSDLTVGEAIDRYIEDRNAVLSPATVRTYKQQRRCYFSGIMNTNITKLTSQQVQAAVNKESKTVSPKTVRNAYGLLTAALSANDINISASLPKLVKSEMVIPTEESIRLLLDAVKGKYMEAVILLAANAGMRRSEICALTWEDINGNHITISKAKVLNDEKKWVIKAPKSYAGTRTIEVPPAVTERLNKLPRKSAEVFPVSPHTMSKNFNRLKRKYKIPFRFHDFRHYNASVMLALGIPDKYAMERLGQATTNVLKNVYQHLMDDKKAEVTKKLNEELSRKICNEICNEIAPSP